MQVFGINIFSTKAMVKPFVNNQKQSYSQNRYFEIPMDSFTPSKKLSFTGSANKIIETSMYESLKYYRELPNKHIMHCMYCEKEFISTDFVKMLLAKGVMNGTLKNFVRTIKPYKEVLRATPAKIFKIIEDIAQKAPHTTLSGALKSLNSEALDILQKQQIPIFRNIKELIMQYPKEYIPRIMKVYNLHEARMKGLPHIETFQAKDFAYKINNLGKTVLDNRLRSILIGYTDIIRSENILENKHLKNMLPKSAGKHKNKKKTPQNLSKKDIELFLVRQIANIGKKLSRDDILYLCKSAEQTIMGEPVMGKFSIKAFKHDLDEVIPEGYKVLNTKIRTLINRLQTSAQDVNAFISKNAFADSNTIGYALLSPSLATIEHITPQAVLKDPNAPKNIKDLIKTPGNWGLACGHCNNSRLHQNMAEYHSRVFPKNTPQTYFNDLIVALNSGDVDLITVLEQKESIARECNMNMRISKISAKTLKDFFKKNPQEQFDKLLDLEKKKLISGDDIYTMQYMLLKKCGISVDIRKDNNIFY